MLEAARPYNLRILGPNSSGLAIPGIGLNASFFHRSALPGKIAFVSQSGGMCSGILDWASAKSIGFSHFIALGGYADVGFAEVIDFLSMEPSTRAILLFMKTLVHSRGFMSAARAATRNKPVLIVKTTGHPEATSISSVQVRARGPIRYGLRRGLSARRHAPGTGYGGAVRGGGNPGPLGSAQER